MRAQLLHLACAGLLLLLLPRVQADCTTLKENCTREADDLTQPLQTNDQKCRNLFLYKTCLEKDDTCSDATTERNAKQAALDNPVCVGADCNGDQCVGANQVCSSSQCACKPVYKISEGICVEKKVDDACTEGNDATCPSSMTCAGTGLNAKCACKPAYKESNSTCVEKMVDDACTEGNDTTCPSSMRCAGTGGNAKCACKPAYKESNATCVVKMVNDTCTAGDASTCPASMECSGDAKCGCKVGYKESNAMCLPKMINDTCNVSTAGDCGTSMDCVNATCKCKSGQGDNGKGECGASCATGYKGTVATSCTPKVINDSCVSGTDGDCGETMDCTGSMCKCKANQGDNGKGVCGSTCAPDYKGTVNACMRKQLGDNCTAGQDQTCPTSMYCNAGVCACPSSQKDNGMGDCAANCASGYGDNGRGQCAKDCAKGFKGDVGNCTEKQVNDNCTYGDNSTCGTNQWCRGEAGNATCACVLSHTSGNDRICVVKKAGDLCTTGNDATCGPNQTCKDGKCGCQDKYKEASDKTCVTAGAAGLLLSLGLHFLPLAVVMAITRWL